MADVALTSTESETKFSLTCDSAADIQGAFAVTSWSGALPADCRYSVVTVMNNPDAKRVKFKLTIRLRR